MARTGRFLDTNIVIELFAREAAIQQRLAEVSEVFVPNVVIGELYYGARKSTRVTENLARNDEFVASSTVLPCSTATAQQYGDIKNTLCAKGRPIPENDIWSAEIAMHNQLTLVARDGHFHEVEGLRSRHDSHAVVAPKSPVERTAHSACFSAIPG
jgi:tRNA(fMet)-specific endonuclease VapC